MGRKDVTAKTYIQTRLVDHFYICIHLTTHLRFTWSSLTKNASNTLLLTGSFERRSDVVAYTELTDFSLCMGVADLNAKGDNEIFLMPTSWGS